MSAVSVMQAFLALLGLVGFALAFQLDSQDVMVDKIIADFQRSQEFVKANWRFSDNALCTAAGVHGRMQKQEITSYAQLANASDLLMRRTTHLEVPVPIYLHVYGYVSHKYKFIWIRHMKSSSTTIRYLLTTTFCEEPTACRPDELEENLQNVTESMWRDYFVFTVVRNPIVRLLSAHNMFSTVLRRRDASLTPGEYCIMPFSEFVKDVFRLETTCYIAHCCSWRKIPRSHGKYEWATYYAGLHVKQQTMGVFTPDGKCLVDYIGRTEHLEDDWKEIHKIIEDRHGREVALQDVPHENSHHDGSETPPDLYHPCLAPAYVAMNIMNKETATALVEQFAMDMRMFDFMPKE